MVILEIIEYLNKEPNPYPEMRMTLKVIMLSVCLFWVNTWAKAQTTWRIDPAHSNVQFEVTHLSISTVTGHFTSFTGEVETKGNNFDGAKVSAEVLVSSVNTENVTRDKHLKKDDFFNAEKFPNMTFRSTSFKRNSDTEYVVTGDLTIRDVTKEITFIATYGGQIKTGKKMISAFRGAFTINRFDYKLKWDDTLDSGGLVVGEEVSIKLSMQLEKT